MSSKVSEAIIGYRKQEKYLLHEFVIMPNHLHLLLTPAAGASIERSMPFIKGGYSYQAGKELGSSGEIWQRGEDMSSIAFLMRKIILFIASTSA